jgi:hypothetical protein
MSAAEFVPVVLALPSILTEASGARDAWRVICARVGEIAQTTTHLPDADLELEVESVAAQLRRRFRQFPPPANLQLLYFGLFSAADPTSFAEVAGFRVAGTTRVPAEIEGSADLSRGVLDYEPRMPYLNSPLLHELKATALANERDSDRYDYALMLGAAATVTYFAVEQLGLRCRVVVGFDSGDAVELRR